MKFTCLNNLWTDSKGVFLAKKKSKSYKKVAFQKGKEYEITPLLYNNTLHFLAIFAVGEDEKYHPIFHIETHWNSNDFACNNFDFLKLEDQVKSVIKQPFYLP